MTSGPTITGHLLRHLAVVAGCDPSTVRRYLRGAVVRRTTRMCLVRAAAELGMTHLLPPEDRRAL
jgi:hypothetical protein